MTSIKKALFASFLMQLYHFCNVTIIGQQQYKPQTFSIKFNEQINDSVQLCIRFNKAHSDEMYIVRLDYLPYVCIQARNDNEMLWNGQYYESSITITKQCNSLIDPTKLDYQFVYEIRRGFKKWGMLFYNHIVEQYLPMILTILIASFLIEKKLFGLQEEHNKVE